MQSRIHISSVNLYYYGPMLRDQKTMAYTNHLTQIEEHLSSVKLIFNANESVSRVCVLAIILYVAFIFILIQIYPLRISFGKTFC